MTNDTSEKWRHLNMTREISGNDWKVLERRTNQDQPMGMEYGKGGCHNICGEGSCKR